MEKNLEHLILPAGVGVGVLLVLLSLRTISFRVLAKRVKKTASSLDDHLLYMVKTPSLFWCFAIAVSVGINLAEISEKQSKPINQLIEILLIISVTIALGNVAAGIFRHLLRSFQPEATPSGLAQGVVRSIVFCMGAVICLGVLGIPIGPILGALGVGGLAVALALKDTLENLFAGVYLIWDRSFRVGDYVRLDSGLEGQVEDISWRTTRIRTGADSILVVPNSKVAQSAINNFSLPDKNLAVTVGFLLDPQTDFEKLEPGLLDIARKGSEDIVGLLATPEPNLRLGGNTDQGALLLNLNFQVRDFKLQAFVSSELRKRAYRYFREKGVKLFKQGT